LKKSNRYDSSAISKTTEGLTGLGTQGMLKNFETIVDKFGADTGMAVAEVINSFSEGLSSTELQDEFRTSLAQTDWTDVDSI
jgi:hypothetical protein